MRKRIATINRDGIGSAKFLSLALCLVLILSISSVRPAWGDSISIRIVASNLTSGNFQRYEAPGKRILQGLQPDIALMQEFNVVGNRDDFVSEVFGPEFFWCVEPGNEQIPTGIVSRWPILQSGEWDDPSVANRDFSWALIDLPGDRNLWAVSVHFLTASPTARENQAQVLAERIAAHVPDDVYLVIGGDLNTGSRSEGALEILSSVVRTAAPWPVDQDGNSHTNANRSRPYDWVLACPRLDARQIPVSIGTTSFTDGLVFDSRVFRPLEAVFPIEPGDSGADGMQHMAVVRDFHIEIGSGSAFDLSGYRIEEMKGDRNQTLILPVGTRLSPGGVLVIGRDATREEFETFWGTMPEDVLYLNGKDLFGLNGWPVINGGQEYRLLDPTDTPVDPPTGRLPSTPMDAGRTYQRTATGSSEMTALVDPNNNATPGRFDGQSDRTGRVILSELSDADGAGNYRFEFVELYDDMIPSATVSMGFWATY